MSFFKGKEKLLKDNSIENREEELFERTHDSELELITVLEDLHKLMRKQHNIQNNLLSTIDTDNHAEKLADKIKIDDQIRHLVKKHKKLLQEIFRDNKRLLRLINKEENIDYNEFKSEMDEIERQEKAELLS